MSPASLPTLSRENAKMEMTGEMMDSALEDALDGDGVEEETEDVMAQVGATRAGAANVDGTGSAERCTGRVGAGVGGMRGMSGQGRRGG